jgi:dihydrofolate reductase
MSRVLLELSISLDGFVAGSNVGPGNPLGDRGEDLHEWMFAGRTAEESIHFEREHFRDVGALIMGRRMADVGIEPWGDEPTFHAPCFVVTHRPHATIDKRGGTSYIFVTEGVQATLEAAREAALTKDVLVNGGADIARQFLDADLVDEIRLHLVPIVLGAGTPLFTGVRPGLRLQPVDARIDRTVTHLTWRRT